MKQPKPGILERAMAFVSPRWAMERQVAREFTNSYQGGVPTRTSEGWQRADGNRFGTTLERYQMGNARDRAYNAFRNNPVARTLVQTETDNVIGDGLNYQPNSDSEAWNREAVDRYYEWREGCSVRGPDVQTGCELERELWQRSRIAGDVGWILVARGAESRIQLVPAENIATPDELLAKPGIYDGIRFDATGAPTAFYVKYQDETGLRRFEPITARDFVYLPHYTDPTQARGETCYATIFDLLSHLDRYVDGVSLAAWMATVFGLVFKGASGGKQLGSLPFLTNSQGAQQRAITLENGQVKWVGAEDEVVQVDAKQPMQQTPDFIQAMMRLIGQPFDMPLEVLAKDVSTVNFSSARIGLLPFYRSCRIKAARFGSRWSRTIRWWLSRESHRAQDDPRRWKTAFPPDYWRHDLLVNAWPYTDPVSEAQADLLEMTMGTKSPQMVITERGRDAKQIKDDFKKWGELAALSSMTRDKTPEPVEPSAPTQPNENNTNAQQ